MIRHSYPFASYEERVPKERLLKAVKKVKKTLLNKIDSGWSHDGYYLCFIIRDLKIDEDTREDLYGYMKEHAPASAYTDGEVRFAWGSMSEIEVRMNWLNNAIKELKYES